MSKVKEDDLNTIERVRADSVELEEEYQANVWVANFVCVTWL